MKKESVLYKIKSLEKMILRNLNSNIKFEINITPTQMKIIEYILDNKEVYQKDLEEVLNLRRATVSGVLQTMEKNNLIKRISCLKDARVKQIVLNEETKKLFKKNKDKLKNIEKEMLKDIDEEELSKFLNIINKMLNNLYDIKKGDRI